MQWKPAGLRCIQESVASHTPFDSSVSDHRTQFKQNTFLPHYSPVSLSLDCFRCSRHPRAALSNGSTHTARHLALGTAPSHKSPSTRGDTHSRSSFCPCPRHCCSRRALHLAVSIVHPSIRDLEGYPFVLPLPELVSGLVSDQAPPRRAGHPRPPQAPIYRHHEAPCAPCPRHSYPGHHGRGPRVAPSEPLWRRRR